MGLDNPLHIAVLVVILLLLFGARRLPEIGRSLGTGMREFKESVTGEAKQPALSATPEQPQPVAPAPAQQAPVPAQAPAPVQAVPVPAQAPAPAQPAPVVGEPLAQPAPPAPSEPQRQA